MQASGGSMSKVRVYEVAKQLNLDPKAVVSLFQAVGINDVRNHMSSVEPEAIERVKRHLEKQRTHDVVEERVRFGVVKRRAVAKPGSPVPADVASAPSLPPSSPPSLHALDDVAVHEPNGRLSQEPIVALEVRDGARETVLPTLVEDAVLTCESEPAPIPEVHDVRAEVRDESAQQDVASVAPVA